MGWELEAEKGRKKAEADHDNAERGGRGGEPERGRVMRVPRGKSNERVFQYF